MSTHDGPGQQSGRTKNDNASGGDPANQGFEGDVRDNAADGLTEASAPPYLHSSPEAVERWLALVRRVRESAFHGAVPGTNPWLRWLSASAGCLFTLVALSYGRLSRAGALSTFFGEYVRELTPWSALGILSVLAATLVLGGITSLSMPYRISYLTIMGRAVFVTLGFWALASVTLWS